MSASEVPRTVQVFVRVEVLDRLTACKRKLKTMRLTFQQLLGLHLKHYDSDLKESRPWQRVVVEAHEASEATRAAPAQTYNLPCVSPHPTSSFHLTSSHTLLPMSVQSQYPRGNFTSNGWQIQ